MTKSSFGLLLAILLAFAVLVWGSWHFIRRQMVMQINSFEECARAGYSVRESFPEQCQTPDGRIFVRQD